MLEKTNAQLTATHCYTFSMLVDTINHLPNGNSTRYPLLRLF
jgi:hypothetical protein